MKILVVDDSRVMRQIITRTLRQAGVPGLRVLEAADGAEGLALARTEHPDLVLSERRLPDKDGLTLLTELRASGSQVPFGFVTIDASDQTRRLAATAGAAFLVTKPFTDEELADALASLRDCPGHEDPEPADRRRADLGRGAALPTAKDVKDLLRVLLDRPVEVTPACPVDPNGEEPVTVAVYVDAHLHPVAHVVCDLPFSAYAASAIGLLPAASAERALAERDLDPTQTANLATVLHTLEPALNLPGHAHVRLYDVHHAGNTAPPAARLAASRRGRREDLEVTIAGYGTGRVSIVVAP